MVRGGFVYHVVSTKDDGVRSAVSTYSTGLNGDPGLVVTSLVFVANPVKSHTKSGACRTYETRRSALRFGLYLN